MKTIEFDEMNWNVSINKNFTDIMDTVEGKLSTPLGYTNWNSNNLSVNQILVWHDPVYQNGYTGYQDPALTLKYSKDKFGIVYLSGLYIAPQSASPGQIVFSLPSGYRPQKNIMLNSTFTTGLSLSLIYIDGSMVQQDLSNAGITVVVNTLYRSAL